MRLSVERDYSILCLNLMLCVVRQQRGDVLDTHWLEILIFLIGEQAEVVCTIFRHYFCLLRSISIFSGKCPDSDVVFNCLMDRCTHQRSMELL